VLTEQQKSYERNAQIIWFSVGLGTDHEIRQTTNEYTLIFRENAMENTEIVVGY
jgi:cell wall assembly regulator SMI1